jgi:hypothetical protein
MTVIKTSIELTESEISILLSALDMYGGGIYEPEITELQRKIHTSLTVAKLKHIDKVF